MVFVDQHKEQYGVEPICRQIQIAPSSYYEHKARERDPDRLTESNPSEIKRFTHTANNFAAIGPLCRHGDLGHQPPASPMKLEEAAKLLLPAAQVFLQKRIKDLKLPEIWQA